MYIYTCSYSKQAFQKIIELMKKAKQGLPDKIPIYLRAHGEKTVFFLSCDKA
jgi:hypothetical protein